MPNKFRYYIADRDYDGSIRGTNELTVAEQYASSEDNYVVDTETGEWFMAEQKREPIQEIKKS